MPSLDWIKLTCDLPQKWQTIRLARLLKVRPDEAVGKLFRFWVYAEHQSRDGIIPGLDSDDIDTLIGKKGFADALVAVGWLEVTAEGLRVPHFDEYMGAANRKRDTEAERKRRQRDGDENDTGQPPELAGTQAGHKRDTSGTETGPQKESKKENKSLCDGSPSPSENEPEKLPAKKPAKLRPRNPLFDAIADVTGIDPATAGSLLGSVSATLLAADPPYSPDDVHAFAKRFHELCPHAAKDTPPRLRPTPKEVERYIGLLRAKPPPIANSRPATAMYD